MIRPATAADLPLILELERLSLTAAHWSEAQYRQMLEPGSDHARLALVTQSEQGQILGFLIAHHIAPDWELENIVVASAARRAGIGKQLLQSLLKEARHRNSESIFLEVRDSNAAARALYQSTGFHQTGRRKSYYPSDGATPAEDAILYLLELEPGLSSSQSS